MPIQVSCPTTTEQDGRPWFCTAGQKKHVQTVFIETCRHGDLFYREEVATEQSGYWLGHQWKGQHALW